MKKESKDRKKHNLIDKKVGRTKKQVSADEILAKRQKEKARRAKNRELKKLRKELANLQKAKFKEFVRGNKKSLLIILVLIFGILIVTFAAIWFVSNDNKYEFEGTITQYYMGQRYSVEEESYLSRGLENTTSFVNSTGESQVTSLVYYREGDDTIILPHDMVYYDPRNSFLGKIDALSEIIVSETGIIAENGNKEYDINRGFLYDGDNYYVFLEPVTVKLNGYSVELSAMSYIEASFQNYVVVFDYESKESIVETTGTEILVTLSSEDYTLSLINDLLEDHQGNKSLLFARPDLLDSVFK